jgi:peptide deformylase
VNFGSCKEISLRLKIMQVGEPVLRQTARPLTQEEILSTEIQNLIVHMHDTMRDAPGVGLAAPQIGLSLQLAVIEDREDLLKDLPPEQLAERERRPVPFQVIFNPTITETSELRPEFFEGCLSLGGFSAIVPRARSVRVECLDEQGQPKTIEAHGWYARILQHEIDHLHGRIYIDRMYSRTFMSLDNWNRYWKGLSAEKIKLALGAERPLSEGVAS